MNQEWQSLSVSLKYNFAGYYPIVAAGCSCAMIWARFLICDFCTGQMQLERLKLEFVVLLYECTFMLDQRCACPEFAMTAIGIWVERLLRGTQSSPSSTPNIIKLLWCYLLEFVGANLVLLNTWTETTFSIKRERQSQTDRQRHKV